MTACTGIATLAVTHCRCVRISPDGVSVLTVGGGLVQMWDAAGGRLGWSRAREALAEFPIEAAWGGGGDTVTLLTGGRLGLLDAVTGADLPLPEELARRADVTAVALSRDGLTLAVGTQEGAVMLWQQAGGRVTRLRGGGDPVTALAWRPGVPELCVARPRSLQVWQPSAEVMSSSVNVGDVQPLRLAWTPDGNRIVVMGLLEVRILSVATRGDSAPPLVAGGRPVGLELSRTGATVLVGMPGGSIELLDRQLRRADVASTSLPADLRDAAALHVNEGGLVAARVGADTVALYALPDTRRSSPERGRAVALRRWAARLARTAGPSTESAVPVPVPHTAATNARFDWADDGWFLQDRASGDVSRFSADGRRRWAVRAGLARGTPTWLSARGGFVAVSAAENRVAILDAATGAEVTTVAGSGPVGWSPQAMAVATPDGLDLHLYDLTWTRGPRTVPAPEGSGTPCWNPDGTLLAGAAVAIWDGLTRTRERTLAVGARPGQVTPSWSPDGESLAVTAGAAGVSIWSTATWQASRRMIPSAQEGGEALAWSPDSRLLAVPARQPIGAVDLWDVTGDRVVLTVPPPPNIRSPVEDILWSRDGRFAVVHDDGTVVSWTLHLPPTSGASQASVPQLAGLAAATAATGTMVVLPLLADILMLLLGRDTGTLAELSHHPGMTMLRSLRWPPEAVVGLAVLVAADLPSDDTVQPPPDADREELRDALERALDDVTIEVRDYHPAVDTLRGVLDRIDDSIVVLAMLLGPDAVAAAPDLLVRVRSQSFGGWSLAPRQQHLLGLRSLLRTDGRSQGRGVGDTRAGIARDGELPSLLPSQLALPMGVLGVKMSRDELLYRTRQGDLTVEAQPLVLILDDTPAAFGSVGVTLRIVGNLLAGTAIRQQRRCALVLLGSATSRFLTHGADLVHLWSSGSVERPDLSRALTGANAAAAQLSDVVGGLPRLVLLTHPYLACPRRAGLHVIRVHYPGNPVDDPEPRTYVLPPGASADEVHEVIGSILADRT